MSKGTKSIAFYLMMILIFGSLMYFIAKEGESQQLENSIASIQNAPSNLEEGFTIFTQLLVHNIESSIGILLLQIITICCFRSSSLSCLDNILSKIGYILFSVIIQSKWPY